MLRIRSSYATFEGWTPTRCAFRIAACRAAATRSRHNATRSDEGVAAVASVGAIARVDARELEPAASISAATTVAFLRAQPPTGGQGQRSSRYRPAAPSWRPAIGGAFAAGLLDRAWIGAAAGYNLGSPLGYT